MITALAGGVGAARFLRGLVQVVDPADVTVVVNTGDDDEFHGLYVCPDLDSVTYTLAGAQNPETGLGPGGRDVRHDRRARPLRRGHLVPARRPRPRHAPLPHPSGCGRAPRSPRSPPRSPPPGASGPACVPDDRRPHRHPHHGACRRRPASWRCRSGSCASGANRRWWPCASTGADAAAAAPGVLDALDAADTDRSSARATRSSRSDRSSRCPASATRSSRRRDRVVGVSPIIGGPAGEGPGRPADGPARDRRVVRGRGARVPRVLQHARDRRRRRGAGRARSRRSASVPSSPTRLMTDARVAAALARDTLAAVA